MEHGHNWKGGRTTSGIYPRIWQPNHLKARMGYIGEHRLIAEKALGKPLPKGCEVHHHTNTQLVICENHAYHFLLHRRTRTLKACGHASWRKCNYCKQYDKPDNLYISPNGGTVYHHKCRRQNYKEKQNNAI